MLFKEILSKKVIQGGMAVNISDWVLAALVSKNGGLGTVSGVANAIILANTLQKGDPGGHFRRALESFPYQKIAKMILDEYFVEGGIQKGASYKKVEMITMNPSKLLIALDVCGTYSIVWLAKDEHTNPISINFMEKIQMCHVYSIVGAMLANVDCITVGAGLGFQFPEMMAKIARGENPSYKLELKGETSLVNKILEFDLIKFDLIEFFGEKLPELKKPFFLPIVSSDLGVNAIIRGCPKGSIDGIVVEGYRAAGHNAPPRLKTVNENKEPIYGPKDECDFEKLKELGIPFWIGGAMSSPEFLAHAISLGAQGIQVGSIFELANGSGLRSDLKNQIRKLGYTGKLIVNNYVHISPTFYPFHEVFLEGTLSVKVIYEKRKRVCNIGLLRTLYVMPDGVIVYRCPAENIEAWMKKGGNKDDALGKVCLCNCLLNNADLNLSEGEYPDITLSKYFDFLKHLMKHEDDSYGVEDVMRYLCY